MTITVTVNGNLSLDQSAGLQPTVNPTDDGADTEVAYSGTATDPLTKGAGALDQAFLDYLNDDIPVALTDAQKEFAKLVGAASSGDTFITVTASAGETVNNLFFSDANGGLLAGAPILIDDDGDGDGVGSTPKVPLRTVAGDLPLFLWTDPNNTDIVLITTSGTSIGAGRIVAVAYLDESDDHLSAQVQMITFEAIKHFDVNDPDDIVDFTDALQVTASGTLAFDFDELESGNFLWAAVGNASGGLLVTGQDLKVNANGELVTGGQDGSNTVNTSQGGVDQNGVKSATIGINSQHFTNNKLQGQNVDGAVGVFTLVRGFEGLDGDATGKDIDQIDYDNYIFTSGASIFISQVEGDNADFRVSLFAASLVDDPNSSDPDDVIPEEGGANSDNPYLESNDQVSLTDDAEIAVGQVVIKRGLDTFTWNLADSGDTQDGITVTFIDANTFEVVGANAEDTIAWTTVGGADFNRFHVQGLATTDGFDIGRIEIDEGATDSEGVGDNLLVEDDAGKIDPLDGEVEFAADATGTVTKSLQGATGTDPRTNPYILTDWTGKDEAVPEINGVTLTAVPNSTTASLITGVSYWADDNGVTGIQTTGLNPDTEFYRLTLNQTANDGAGSYTFQVLVDPPPAFLEFDFKDLPSGQNLFAFIAAKPGELDGQALLCFSNASDVDGSGRFTNISGTINTSKGGGPITIGDANQMYDNAGEGAVFVYALNPKDASVAGAGLTQKSADDADNTVFVDTFTSSVGEVELVQIQGNDLAALTIRAYDIDMSAFDTDPNSTTDDGVNTNAESRGFVENPETNADEVNVTAVTVTIGGVVVEKWADTGVIDGVYELQDINDDGVVDADDDNANVDVDFEELLDANQQGTGIYIAHVSGLSIGGNVPTLVTFETEDPHDMAKIDYLDGAYDIGGFNLREGLDTPDQPFEFTARVTDGDTDTAENSWTVTIDGTGLFDSGDVNPQTLTSLSLSGLHGDLLL